MKREKLSTKNFKSEIFDLWGNKWLLLTSGDHNKGEYNSMTVAWGSMGVMWNKAFVQIVVRPTRYTHEFTEKHDSFTVCAFPDKYRDDLKYLGTVSGRDENKLEKSSLTPEASDKISSPSFKEAELVFECRKIFRSEFKPEQFIDKKIMESYDNDYHTVYYGEIMKITGIKKYMS